MHTPNIHALSVIRTHDPSDRASEDSSRLRLHGYCERLIEHLQNVTTNNYDSLTELYIQKITLTAAHIKSSQSVVSSPVFAW
jgi:hypothetical protein